MSNRLLASTNCAKKTFFYDNIRCFFTGILEAGFKTFVLLIAIRVFHAPNICKAVLSSIGFMGLLIAPMMVTFASKLKNIPSTNICGYYFILITVTLMISAVVDSFLAYFILIAISRVIFKQYIPLMIDVYGNNYNKQERGYKLSYSLMILPTATIIFSPIGGYILDANLNNYRIILLIISLAAVSTAYTFFKIPSRPIPVQKNSETLLSNFKIILQDKLFFIMLIIMMFTGIATQMTTPLRAEYLANEKYGISISNFLISIIIVTIPYGCRIASSIFWGKLFDKFSLIKMRVIVNIFILIGILLFFNSTTVIMLILSAIFTGIGYSGGEIVWCLWLTKIVDKDKLSRYMSANTAFVGIRSFISPFIGYFLIDNGVSFPMIGLIAASLVFLSIIGCFLIHNHPRFFQFYE